MTVSVKPFHAQYPMMPPLFHTYCTECPDYGICDVQHVADADAAQHQFEHDTKPKETHHA